MDLNNQSTYPSSYLSVLVKATDREWERKLTFQVEVLIEKGRDGKR